MRASSLRVLPLAAALFVGACTEPSAPEAPVSEVAAFKIFPTYASDGKSADLLVEPSGGVFYLGKHALYFPANTTVIRDLDLRATDGTSVHGDHAADPIQPLLHEQAAARGRFQSAPALVPSDDDDRGSTCSEDQHRRRETPQRQACAADPVVARIGVAGSTSR